MIRPTQKAATTSRLCLACWPPRRKAGQRGRDKSVRHGCVGKLKTAATRRDGLICFCKRHSPAWRHDVRQCMWAGMRTHNRKHRPSTTPRKTPWRRASHRRLPYRVAVVLSRLRARPERGLRDSCECACQPPFATALDMFTMCLIALIRKMGIPRMVRQTRSASNKVEDTTRDALRRRLAKTKGGASQAKAFGGELASLATQVSDRTPQVLDA